MPPTAASEKEGSELGITCPPDRVPQTPAGGRSPPAPPAQQLQIICAYPNIAWNRRQRVLTELPNGIGTSAYIAQQMPL